MIIHGGQSLTADNDAVLLDSCGDHRIAMMNAIAALITTGDVILTGEDEMSVSYPGFLEDLSEVML